MLAYAQLSPVYSSTVITHMRKIPRSPPFLLIREPGDETTLVRPHYMQLHGRLVVCVCVCVYVCVCVCVCVCVLMLLVNRSVLGGVHVSVKEVPDLIAHHMTADTL